VQAARAYTAQLRIGPWFVRGPVRCPPRVTDREPSPAMITVARTFSGRGMLELIQQHDEAPSVYLDVVQTRGYGFHHWGIAVRDFDAELAHHQRLGARVAMLFEAPTGARVAYLDAPGFLPGMIEVIEMTPAHEATYDEIFQAAQGWDGHELTRPDR